MEYRDEYTDHMIHQGRMLHSKTNKPIMPGRGMGLGDAPDLKLLVTSIPQTSIKDQWVTVGCCLVSWPWPNLTEPSNNCSARQCDWTNDLSPNPTCTLSHCWILKHGRRTIFMSTNACSSSLMFLVRFWPRHRLKMASCGSATSKRP